jgi:PAS domain S-box-containing protein
LSATGQYQQAPLQRSPRSNIWLTLLGFRSEQRGLAIAILLGPVIVPTLLIGVSLEINHQFKQERVLRAAVDRSYSERLQMQNVFSLMQDAETGARGFVITGQPPDLEPLQNAERKIGPALTKLEATMRSADSIDRTDPDLILKLRTLVTERLQLAENTVRTRQTEGSLGGIRAVAAGNGKRVMDEIRAVVAQMGDQQNHALARRIATFDRFKTDSERIVQAMFVSLCAILAIAYVLVLLQMRGRQILLNQARNAVARRTAILENAQDAIIIFKPSGTIESLNHAAETMFGNVRDALVRRDIAMLLDVPGDAGPVLDRLGVSGTLETGALREFTARRSSGETFPVEASLGLIPLPEGLRVIVSMRDISERRRIDAMKSEFISSVSHELRTPLTSIAGSLGLLIGGGGDLPDRTRRLLGIAYSNCQRLVRLINDLLDIEKIQSGKMEFNMAFHDMAELARHGVEAIAGMALEQDVQVVLTPTQTPLMIEGDSDRIAQVIANLLSNAVKFSPAHGEVTVTVDMPNPGRVSLSVRDRGPGVPLAFHDRIFSKFAQADSSDTRQKGGTGLGLAISKEIVERHGGSLGFDSTPGEGATFSVDLPAHAAAAAAKSPSQSTENGTRILLCEDDKDIAEVLRETLLLQGLNVTVVGGIAEAEAALAGPVPFKILLLDVRLPDGSGLDLLARLRADPITEHLPVLIISAEAGVGHAIDVIDWLQKPVDMDRLRHALDVTIAKGRASPVKVLHVEDDLDVRAIVADALGDHYKVTGVEGLASARHALRQATPDLVILDIGLADGSGIDLLPDLKLAGGRNIPVLIFSAESVDERAVADSVVAVLTKSKMSLDQLTQAVRSLANRQLAEKSE